ncbi:MAG: hypothetical protein KDA60_07210, partial [Planctomycetales bacterium]|nr:hypothetical protein [Planctomycetales bacterium]
MRPNFLFVAAVLLIPAAGIHAEPNDSSAASQTPSAEEIHGLIVELDAASYESRRSAMQQLIQIGRGVPSTLAPAISQGERELVTRGVHILEVLATNDEPQLRDEARDALIGVVEQSESPTARAQA